MLKVTIMRVSLIMLLAFSVLLGASSGRSGAASLSSSSSKLVASTQTDCATKTDDDIEKVVIEKLKTKFRPNNTHTRGRIFQSIFALVKLHISSVNKGDITLQGWAATEDTNREVTKAQIIELVKSVPCVKSVKADRVSTQYGDTGCDPPNTKPCGTLCVPANARC